MHLFLIFYSSVWSGYSEFPNNHIFIQLSLLAFLHFEIPISPLTSHLSPLTSHLYTRRRRTTSRSDSTAAPPPLHLRHPPLAHRVFFKLQLPILPS